MLSKVRDFKSLIPKQVQQIILLVLGVFVLVRALDGNSRILPFLIAFLPVILILGAVFILAYIGEYFAAHLILFVLVFDEGIRNLFNAVTSYHFFWERFTADFDIYLFLFAIGGIYLLLMCISYLWSGEVKLNLNFKPIAFPVLIFSIWSYVCYGFTTTLIVVLLAILAVSSGSIFAALMVLLFRVIVFPVMIINLIDFKSTKFTDITFWLIALSSFYVIYIIIKEMLKHKHLLLKKEV